MHSFNGTFIALFNHNLSATSYTFITKIPMRLSENKLPFSFKLVVGAAVVGSVSCAVRNAVRHRRHTTFAGKTVLISGGSRGLGLELARAFASEEADLILIGREIGKLMPASRSKLRQSTFTPGLCNSFTDGDQVRKGIAYIAQGGAIDVLINNAGRIRVGPADKASLRNNQIPSSQDTTTKQTDRATCRCTHATHF